MNISHLLTTTVAVVTAFSLLLTACDLRLRSNEEEGAGEKRVLTKNIRMENVQTVNTHISMKAGKLTITGGAKDLVEADIQYSREKWKPEINFSDDGKAGHITIEQPEMPASLNLDLDDEVNTWNIRLNDRVVQDLYCEIGAGQTELDLRGLKLNRVRIDAGVGEHNIDLRDCSVPELEINAGIGKVTIDLTGEWHNDLDAEISGGIGELNLQLPGNAGIRMEVNGGLGDIDAPALKRDGRMYTNELYGKAEYTLHFDIKAGLGSIEVEVDEDW